MMPYRWIRGSQSCALNRWPPGSHSGDLGVMRPDGYVRLMDRAKDVVLVLH